MQRATFPGVRICAHAMNAQPFALFLHHICQLAVRLALVELRIGTVAFGFAVSNIVHAHRLDLPQFRSKSADRHGIEVQGKDSLSEQLLHIPRIEFLHLWTVFVRAF